MGKLISIKKCKNPFCLRYFRGLGLYCSRICACKCDPEFLKIDTQLQEMLKKEYEKQEGKDVG